MNTCERFSELFSDYIENFLPASSKQQVESHLSACADCHDTVARLDDLRSHLKSLKHIQASDDFEAILRARIKLDQRARRSSVSAKRRTRPMRMASYSVIAAVIVMSFGYLLWRTETDIQAATPASTSQMQTPVAASLTLNPASFSAKILYPLDRIAPTQLSHQNRKPQDVPSTSAMPDTSQPAPLPLRGAAQQGQFITVSSF